ncbi:MAG: tRNA (adenosine(37)-N6)-threonylcarbamoyltransferase complex dimerization subunit type 1 TsaB [Oscillospiraceae bacterium]|nr:tRNA (adenosine(37)-N6)-threonylcarbamoyltransferase complex dimerization subunit type 1 TsaB [Oscillospiraceae bacterium]
MRILGIDTSGTVAAAAIYDSEKDIILAQQVVYTKRTHSQVILPLAERLLDDTGLSLSDIDKIAVAAGPGSYTGLRIGIAAVKAMSFALDIPCCGVSTLKSLCFQANTAGEGKVCAVMKARKGLVYAGIYHFDSDRICTAIMEDMLIPEEELLKKLSEYGRVLLTGDGAADFMEEYSPETAVLVSAEARLQNGAGLCRSAVFCDEEKPEELEARYLQLVKAEKDRLDGKN